jgi:Coenzyme PQQ synthesis protein D (PqqD)
MPSPLSSISFDSRVRIPDDVLISHLQDESVILHLDSERYFGLDEVGTRMLTVLSASDSIEAAYEQLLAEYEVDPPQLRQDLTSLIESLVQQGLVTIEHR